MAGTAGATEWRFTDDRGALVRAPARPRRVVAYVRAGAALHDLGVTPVAVYGSGHDGPRLDPAKAGGLPAATGYLGTGFPDAGALAALERERPDLVVDVTYDGKGAYACDEDALARLGVPVAALAVSGDRPLAGVVERFGDLAAALGGTGALLDADAEDAVRRAAGDGGGPRVLALSGAGPDTVYLARPDTWPELRRLRALGVDLAEPDEGPGVNWLTTGWDRVRELRPDLLLVDDRAHAARPPALDAAALPWNPETPPSPVAYGRFFRAVADALEHLRAER
ncbi:ABC transporter substrate-binding protein [Streptomyces sp. NPDC001941]|uniref:ABC transporter substrate-binding protein n=1 Tax=Streptomyces sp. NPDC001941 TaxID=3154659 RepID=UPI00332D0567